MVMNALAHAAVALLTLGGAEGEHAQDADAPAAGPLGVDQPRLQTAAELDALLAPFAGAPQDALGMVLDACRYPADLLAASHWAHQAEATRGPPSQAWPPTVPLLAERAPRAVEFLTQDMGRTAALGLAYRRASRAVAAWGRAVVTAAAPPLSAAWSASAPACSCRS